MKKQNVNNKLAFNKAIVTELNEQNLLDVNGGTGTVTLSTVMCSIAVVSITVAVYLWD